MLSTELVDMMLGWVKAEAQRRHIEPLYTIERTTIWSGIWNARPTKDSPQASYPDWVRHVAKDVETGSGRILLLPIVYNQHFVLAEVNSRSRTLTFGMFHFVHLSWTCQLISCAVNSIGQGTTVHRNARIEVERWLKTCFERVYTCSSTTSLPSGQQTDGTSCGICVANVVAHAVLGDAPWTQDAAVYHRVQWAQRLAKAQFTVRACILCHCSSTNCTQITEERRKQAAQSASMRDAGISVTTPVRWLCTI